MLHADIVKEFIEFLHGSSRDGDIGVAEESQYRRFEFGAQLINHGITGVP
jgi:hypothetical protein